MIYSFIILVAIFIFHLQWHLGRTTNVKMVTTRFQAATGKKYCHGYIYINKNHQSDVRVLNY